MTHDEEKGAEALQIFLSQFGQPDVYTNIMLEVLFEEFYGVNSAESSSDK